MEVHSGWRNIRFGIGRIEAEAIPRHQHLDAYATLVVSGSYEQVSYAGRFRVQAGDILIQPTLDFHSDSMLSSRALIVRLPWDRDASFGGVYRGVPSDLVRHIADRDPLEAANVLKQQLHGMRSVPALEGDWSDKLAADLRAAPNLRIVRWANANGLTRESIWRCFSRDFGVSPAQFRSELNARNAWLALTGSREPLSKIATEFGFSDQAHMTRAVKSLTGVPPARWRAVLGAARRDN